MGTWSVDAYGNDEAVDWSYSLEGARSLSPIDQALDGVLSVGNKYLDASDARVALAAIDALTRFAGRGGTRNAYTRTVDKWASAIKLKPDAAMVARAREVICRILAEDSELKQLWQESADYDEWLASLRSLEQRITG